MLGRQYVYARSSEFNRGLILIFVTRISSKLIFKFYTTVDLSLDSKKSEDQGRCSYLVF